jgi:hypothetical protein
MVPEPLAREHLVSPRGASCQTRSIAEAGDTADAPLAALASPVPRSARASNSLGATAPARQRQRALLTQDNYLRPRSNALTGRRLVIMEARQIIMFADRNLDYSLKLAIAHDLQRQLSAVLNEPLPPDLQCIIDRLQKLVVRGAER